MSGDAIATGPADQDEVVYARLRHLLKRAEVVPFLGAGSSLVASGQNELEGLPTGRVLANRLAAMLGATADDIDSDDLIEVASCFQLLSSRQSLEIQLGEVFGVAAMPGPLHRFIAELNPPPRLIVTTNYDTLIEQAFRQAGREFHLIMTPIQEARALMWWGPNDSVARTDKRDRPHIQPSDLPIVYKMHGGVAPNGEWVSSIVTDDDYFKIGGRIYEASFLPPLIGQVLTSGSFLFLGHSLRDIHVRFLIEKATSWSHNRHCLVNTRVSRLDRIRFQQLGVDSIELSIDTFLDRLLAVMNDRGDR